MKITSLAAVMAAVACVHSVSAQINYSEYLQNGEPASYSKTAVFERDIVTYPYLREADVKYCKRLISCIDGRQKQNKVIEWPRNSLCRVLYENVLKGELVAYKNDSLSPYSVFNIEEIAARGNDTLILDVAHPEFDGEFIQVPVVNTLNIEDMHKFLIMEDWVFDYKHSVFKPRIIAIAPLYKPKMEGLPELPETPWCWIKMDEGLRRLLARQELFNTFNDGGRLSYDDFFQMHMFSSYVVKESNVFDLEIRQFQVYADDAVAALLESDRIKNDLLIFEHDLWQY